MTRKLLSKSKYMNGLQCPKLLWITFNEPERIPAVDAGTQHRFDQGHLVGELARKIFPGGIDLTELDPEKNMAMTRAALSEGKTCFEAGFGDGKIFSRLDILKPVSTGEWDIIEVKSSTKVKDEYLDDVAFQKYCCTTTGLAIRKCYVMHINNEYVKSPGNIEPKKLFIAEDVTSKIEVITPEIEDRIKTMFQIIGKKKCPHIAINASCSHPYACALQDECWSILPERSIFDLTRGGRKCFQLFEQGIVSITDIPADFSLNTKQKIQKSCEISGKPNIDKAAIQSFLDNLQYPLYFLDFETFNTAIPLYDGTVPFQRIPFQYSLHFIKTEHSEPKHYSFLADGIGDPRPKLLNILSTVIGDRGSVLVYNKGFENSVLKELAAAFPEHSKWIDNVCNRLVDLILPFQSFAYYHPDQKGSASLKKVLPALTGTSYDDLDIGNGEDASLAFLDMMFGDLSEDEKQEIREDLLEYCGLDTEGMIDILNRLVEISNI